MYDSRSIKLILVGWTQKFLISTLLPLITLGVANALRRTANVMETWVTGSQDRIDPVHRVPHVRHSRPVRTSKRLLKRKSS